MPKINRQIRAGNVRVVDHNGDMVGVISIDAALRMAQDVGLDLVEVSPNADPPVCKIIDFSKYKYNLRKKLKETKKNQKVVLVKDIKLRPSIGEHDLLIKIKSIKGFIEDGFKVKVALMFRGREMSHTENGRAVFNKILSSIDPDSIRLELEPKMQGNQLIMVIAPAMMKV